MKQFLILSCWMVFSFSTGFSQEDVIKTTRHEVDSIMNLIDREKLAIAIILYRNNLHRKKANIVLEKTLTELKATQSQLVQSEKMASLGELTAGIAHEIQNPLNFVNNFSEINAEMLDEANDAINKGDIDELKQILINVKDNSAGYEKIKQSFNCVPIGKHVLKNKSAEMMLYEVLD